MPTFLAILFPFIAAVGFNQVFESLKLVWQGNHLEATLLQAKFELYIRKVWARRWKIIIWSLCYLFLSGATSAVGVLSENSLFVSLGGLAIAIYIYIAGLTVRTVVSIHQRINVHNSETSKLLPAEFNQWLRGLGIIARPFRLVDQSTKADKKLLDKIELVYMYATMVVLFFTFWLGLFPDAKIWVIAIVVFSGSMLWLLLSRLLGEDGKKALKFLKVLVAVWVLIVLKIMISTAIFPNIAMAWKTKVKPLFEERVSSFMVDVLTPSKAEIVIPALPPAPANPSPAAIPLPPLNGAVSSPNTYINNSTTSFNGDTPTTRKKRPIKEYLDAHMLQ